ncbi:MAG TPA: tRNA adenosine(34) deaminase TadA [Candidatus Polarisedimenticolia bacterium]|nr:tRNA adenosine(34) deaminase TadA [Candidatus Polarisedimenticolia bacterium]
MEFPSHIASSGMDRALRLARAAGRRGEIPVGAVVLRDGEVLGAAGNRSVSAHDPTGHAEIGALRRAARRAGNYRLTGSILVVTLEPCLMCLGAMVHARIGALVFGARDPKIGAVAALATPALAGLNHRFSVHGGVRDEECAALLRDFFQARRHAPGVARSRAAARGGAMVRA